MDDTAAPLSAPAQVESVIRRLSLLQADGETTADPFVAPLFPGFHFDTRLVAGITPIERGGPLDFRKAKPIGQDIDSTLENMDSAHGYDHNFVLNHREGGMERRI